MPNLSAQFSRLLYKPKSQRKSERTQGPRVTSDVRATQSSLGFHPWRLQIRQFFNYDPHIMEKNSSHEKRIQVIKEAVTAATALAPLLTIKPSYGLL